MIDSKWHTCTELINTCIGRTANTLGFKSIWQFCRKIFDDATVWICCNVYAISLECVCVCMQNDEYDNCQINFHQIIKNLKNILMIDLHVGTFSTRIYVIIIWNLHISLFSLSLSLFDSSDLLLLAFKLPNGKRFNLAWFSYPKRNVVK